MSSQGLGVPVWRDFTRALPTALNLFALTTDDVTNLTFYRSRGNNTILDMVNQPNPTAGVRFDTALFLDGYDQNRHFNSVKMDASSAGRPSIGPIPFRGPRDVAFSSAQTVGALEAYRFTVKFESG